MPWGSPMPRGSILPLLALTVLAGTAAAQPPPPPPPGSGGAPAPRFAPLEARPAPGSPIAVPEGSGAPVITDGLFSPGEWEAAQRIPVGNSVGLYFQQWRDVVYIGIRGESGGGIGPSEVGLAVPGGPILKLHVSSQLAEATLSPGGEFSPMRMGFSSGWYANEQRRDEALIARLQKEGRPPGEVMQAASYPSDGIELAVRRSKLPGEKWLLRLSASAVDGGRPGMLTWPAGTEEKATAGWVELSLK